MTKQQKITLSASRDIPFNKLMLSQSNVRHVKAGVWIEELAGNIAPDVARLADDLSRDWADRFRNRPHWTALAATLGTRLG